MEKTNSFQLTKEFDGVFRFTNATKDDFIALWNNKEYVFPAGMCCPMILPDETLENIQEIRKKFAYKLAVREFYNSKEYRAMSKMGRGLPPTYDDKVLQPWIDQCLSPLPMGKAKVTAGKAESEKNYKASKALTEKDNPNFLFREESDNAKPLGKMSNQPIQI